ncbi:MAG TPA: aminoacyl-tRNA hydrolase [Desulfomonilaceae bacterium]|nr:aminoacyl-tRNA hydrolase [Desulfomonilaceae bacterium]
MRGFSAGKQRLIVGLGNPGRNYERHRHNLGFMVVDHLAGASGWSINREKNLVCEVEVEGEKVCLLKPQTYMNRSGSAAWPALDRLNSDPARMIVIHDDLDLTPGKVRIKIGGGDGGHRGVRSIADSLRFRDFIRIRLGIGRPPAGVTPEEFVLMPFDTDEEQIKKELISTGCNAIGMIISGGIEHAQQCLHSTKITAVSATATI